jgi:two-component system chemotaxis response regulator CheY
MQTCLIVDDSRVVRRVSRRIFEALGYEVSEAEDGVDALKKCEFFTPDLIMLDWHMPEMNGIDFLKAYRQTANGSKPIIIFCTTENDMSNMMEAISSGANEYVMKPFDEDIIRDKLTQVGLL